MRQTSILITYEGKNITEDISPYLLFFSYNDNSKDTADDLSISLEDRKGLWLSNWTPSKGDKIQVSIESEKNILPCGSFEVDQIEYSCPPKILSIKAISVAVSKKLSSEKHSRAWENANISRVIKDIAQDNNLGVYFESEQDYFFERKEQANQSDLEFLSELLSDYGLNLKVNDGKIIVYDLEKQEEKKSVCEIDAYDKKITGWKFTSKSANIFSKAKVKYHDAKKGRLIEAETEDDSVEGTGKTLELSIRAENESDAIAIAEKKLHDLNAKEITGSINLMGDTRFLAGVNIDCKNFGLFSGKYFLSRVSHNFSRSGYVTELSLQMGSSEKKAVKSAKKKKQGGGKILYYEGDKYYHAEK